MSGRWIFVDTSVHATIQSFTEDSALNLQGDVNTRGDGKGTVQYMDPFKNMSINNTA